MVTYKLAIPGGAPTASSRKKFRIATAVLVGAMLAVAVRSPLEKFMEQQQAGKRPSPQNTEHAEELPFQTNKPAVYGTAAILQDVWGDMVNNKVGDSLGLTSQQRNEANRAFSYTSHLQETAEAFSTGQDYHARLDLEDGSFVGLGIYAERGREEVLAIHCTPCQEQKGWSCGTEVATAFSRFQVSQLRGYQGLTQFHNAEPRGQRGGGTRPPDLD